MTTINALSFIYTQISTYISIFSISFVKRYLFLISYIHIYIFTKISFSEKTGNMKPSKFANESQKAQNFHIQEWWIAYKKKVKSFVWTNMFNFSTTIISIFASFQANCRKNKNISKNIQIKKKTWQMKKQKNG